TQEDKKRALDIQRRSLQSFAEAYDQGETWYAIWLAASTYVVVEGEGQQIASLLSQLGVRNKMFFLASAPSAHPKNLVAQTPLLVSTLRGDGSANMTPLCACSENPFIPRWLPFDAWWRDEVIFQDGDFRLNRQRLVFALRNKEGGGHFDAVVTD